MSYTFNDVGIEITRKCNMKCRHCLRGNAQNIDINMSYVKDFLSNCSHISTLTISGGEPSLNIEGIKNLLNLLKKLDISVEQFYVVTNGSKTSYSKEFINIMMELWYYQEEKDIDNMGDTLQLTVDNFHDKTHQQKAIDKLSALSFFSVRDNTNSYVQPEGRGKNLLGYCNVLIKKYTYTNTITIDGNSIETLLYLNCKGKVLTDCDLSFTRQDRLKGWSIGKFNEYLEN